MHYAGDRTVSGLGTADIGLYNVTGDQAVCWHLLILCWKYNSTVQCSDYAYYRSPICTRIVEWPAISSFWPVCTEYPVRISSLPRCWGPDSIVALQLAP